MPVDAIWLPTARLFSIILSVAAALLELITESNGILGIPEEIGIREEPVIDECYAYESSCCEIGLNYLIKANLSFFWCSSDMSSRLLSGMALILFLNFDMCA